MICPQRPHITLFKSKTLLYGTDIIMQNIPSFKLNVRNIPHDTISSTEHYFSSK